MALGDGKKILAQRSGDDSYLIGLGLQVPAHWSLPQKDHKVLRAELIEKHFADWSPVITDMIARSQEDFRLWSLYAMPPELLSWDPGAGVTLVGDAAHVTYATWTILAMRDSL